MVLILLGDGVVAGVLLKGSKAEGSGWIVITAGWAFAVMAGVFTAIACGSSDAHLNPAVTLGMAVKSGDFSKVVQYMTAQMLGAIVAAALERDAGCRSQTCLLLHVAGNSPSRCQPAKRDHRQFHSRTGGGRHFLE